MKKKITLKCLILFLLPFTLFSQEIQLSSLLIPQELKENANAVVRDSNVEVTVLAQDKLIVKEKRIVTVLNKLGKVEIAAYKHYNNHTKITKLSAIIYDAFGSKIKKYSKSKFTDVSAVDGGTLYSDSRLKYLDYTPTSYPYTVVFESEYKTSSTGFIRGWFPINGYRVSVEKSSYTFINNANITFRKKVTNFKKFDVKQTNNPTGFKYSITNQKAIKYEKHSVNSRDFLPVLKVSLNNFTLKNVTGFAKDWNEFGLWMNTSLLKGQTTLSEETKTTIQNLVKDVNNPIEKAKIVYKFMQNKTRYINVSIGIGGWKPIAANKVDNVGYGDCKGLTNYTKALLDVVGVESYHTIVYANERRDIDKNFTALQGNHMILNIPNNGKDIWLECTSQTMPFGFLGDFTDDRDVLVITPKGGVIKRTPKYINDDNLQTITAKITLDERGNVKASFNRVSKGIQYNDKFYTENLSKEDLKKQYISDDWSYNNNFEIENITLINDKDAIVFTENLNIKISSYASVNQENYLFRVNVLNKNSYVPKRYRKRIHPLKISRGYTNKDEFTISLPKGFYLENLPSEKIIETKFGTYKVHFEKIDASTIKYNRVLAIKKGIYPKEDYKLYRKFRKSVAKYDNLRISLIKKN